MKKLTHNPADRRLLALRFFFLLLTVGTVLPLQGQIITEVDTITMREAVKRLGLMKYHYNDSILLPRRNPFKAGLETVGLNVGVWAFDRYVLDGDFAYISLNTMSNNIKHGFVWDNDQFSTNLFAHPYHGGLYFNTARCNGMTFWESLPYSIGGSLMWEFLMENEPPAINDFIATSIGGACLGEVTYRLSDLIIDDRTTGWQRFGREFLTTLVSPMRGLNRIMSGDAWRHRTIRGRSLKSTPAMFYVTAGHRALAEDSEIRRELDNGMYVDFALIYGNLFDDENDKPYDAFSLRATFNMFSQQPLISSVNAIGQLWGTNIPLKRKNRALHVGVFQHFDYYDSDAVLDGEKINSYRISEAAAFGGGIMYAARLNKNMNFATTGYLNAILLGGSITDHYQNIDRDYNMGSGFSSKLYMEFFYKTRLNFGLRMEDYRLFTWKGYDPNVDISQLTHEEQLHLNAQGDKGNANLTIMRLDFNYRFKKRFTVSLETSYYLRNSHYKYFPDKEYQVIENKIGLGYVF